jgi:hypothetical protein
MPLRILMSLDEIKQIQFAGVMSGLRQPSTKQFVPEPQMVCVDHVAFAVFGDLLDPALSEVPLHLSAIDIVRLSWQPHDPGDLVQRGPRAGIERRKRVAEVDGIFRVSAEVGSFS